MGHIGVHGGQRFGQVGLAEAGEPPGLGGGVAFAFAVAVVAQSAHEHRVGQPGHHQLAASPAAERFGLQDVDEGRQPGGGRGGDVDDAWQALQDWVVGLADEECAADHNGGVLATVAQWTDEGLERTFVLNYLSRYLLVRPILPRLAAGGRIVLVANAGKYRDTLELETVRAPRNAPQNAPHSRQQRRRERGLYVAGRSQFANDLLAVELTERVRDHGINVKVACVFPGLVATDVFRNAIGLPAPARVVATAVQRLIGMPPEAAAATPVWLAGDPDAITDADSGVFFGPRRRRLRVPQRVLRSERRAALWAASEDLAQPWLAEASQAAAGRSQRA